MSCFNSMMVRLIGWWNFHYPPCVGCFNSMMVRLIASINFEVDSAVVEFQFHDGSIDRCTDCVIMNIILGFNSMMVRLIVK